VDLLLASKEEEVEYIPQGSKMIWKSIFEFKDKNDELEYKKYREDYYVEQLRIKNEELRMKSEELRNELSEPQITQINNY
jgi:hypothetical protein